MCSTSVSALLSESISLGAERRAVVHRLTLVTHSFCQTFTAPKDKSQQKSQQGFSCRRSEQAPASKLNIVAAHLFGDCVSVWVLSSRPITRCSHQSLTLLSFSLFCSLSLSNYHLTWIEFGNEMLMNVMKWVFEMCLCVREFLTAAAAAVKTDGQNGGANCTESDCNQLKSLWIDFTSFGGLVNLQWQLKITCSSNSIWEWPAVEEGDLLELELEFWADERSWRACFF